MSAAMFKGTLLISDMDGTLLDSQSRVSLENQAALKYFVDQGGLFTVATGRVVKSLTQYLPLLPINVPAILFNGAMIYDFGTSKVLWQINLPDGIRQVVANLSTRFPGLGIEVCPGEAVYSLSYNQEVEKHMVRNGFPFLAASVDQVPAPWIKIILVWEPEKLPMVESYLADCHPLIRTVYSEPQFLEILPLNVSKGHALKKLVELLGYKDLKVVAMGDNLNDLEMIQMADLGIAVNNAHPVLKKAARFHYGHYNTHAVAQVVEYLKDKIIS